MGPAGTVRVGRSGELRTTARTAEAGRAVTAGMRPVDLHPAESDELGIDATVVVFEYLLEFVLGHVAVPGLDSNLVTQTPGYVWLNRGDHVRMTAAPERVYLFDTETGQRIR